MIGITTLGIHPKYNMLPDGAVNIGALKKEALLQFTIEEEVNDEERRYMLQEYVVDQIIKAEKEGNVSRNPGASAVFVVWKDGIVSAAVNLDGAFEVPENWSVLKSKNKIFEDPMCIPVMMQGMKIRNAAAAAETDDGELYILPTTTEELIKWMSEDLGI